jgi:hypothetical protein
MAHYADPTADSRLVLRDVAETLIVTFYSGETATDADGAVTIGIVDSAGATVVAAGTSATSVGSGVYSYALAAQSNLKELTATWSGTWGSAMAFDTAHEVVGGFYTVPAEVRAMDSISGESTTFTAADVVEAVTYATAIIDDYTGASWVQRYQRDVMNGTNGQTIKVRRMFPQTLLAASVDGTALTASEISDVALFENGQLTRKDKTWTFTEPGNLVVIDYEHGVGSVAPPDIRWAAKTLARYHLLEQVSRIPDRAISVQSEFGQIQLAQPGMNRPTPLPDVNVVLNRHRHRAPVAF